MLLAGFVTGSLAGIVQVGGGEFVVGLDKESMEFMRVTECKCGRIIEQIACRGGRAVEHRGAP